MKKIIFGVIGSILALGILFFNAQPDGLLHVYFLNVGQGDATLIRGPDGENIIIDGGPGQNILKELSETLPYFDNAIDWLILTHPDRDHIEGFIYVLRRYRVKNILFIGASKDDYFSDTFLEEITQKNIPVVFADAESDVTFPDGLVLDTLYPFEQMVGGRGATSNLSIVTKIVYFNNEVLVTGDADTQEEEKLLNKNVDLHADVLKLGHHGSATSTGEKFLKAVSPAYGVISVGKGNTYHHPHPSTLKKLQSAGVKILRTDINGRIEFAFNKEKILSITPAPGH